MAVDMFLKLDGVTGESRDSKHKDWIEVLSWSWGADQSGKAGNRGGAGSGKVHVHDLQITKYMDKSSPVLMLFCCNGKHVAKGNLVCRKSGGDSAVEYFNLELDEVIVTNYSTGGTASDDQQMESLSLNFAKFKGTYTPQSKTGSGDGAVAHGWDIAENKKA